MLDILTRCMFLATGAKLPTSARDRRGGAREEGGESGLKPWPVGPVAYRRKLDEFTRLHRAPGAFLMPNAWDAGTARLLEGLGFPALATTSAGLAFSMGVRDSSRCLSRRQVLDNARSIVEATSLPVSADLEDGFGASPEDCARTVREAADIGLCGGAIEDATGDPNDPIHGFELAVARIRAAVEAKPVKGFLVTARAENFIHGRPDLGDTIRRLKAFEEAGADALYAPGLPDIPSVRAACDALTAPVNVVVGFSGATYTVDDLAEAGVKRVSTGGSLARAALGEMIRAATELRESGTHAYADRAISDLDAACRMRVVRRVED